ncbi:MAG: hypothetical protein RIB80_04710 [Rhodospirillales bacterium]
MTKRSLPNPNDMDLDELEAEVAEGEAGSPKGSFPLFVDKLMTDTLGWSDDLRFKYIRLLDQMYKLGGYLPDDLKVIAEVSGINRARNWRESAEKLRCILLKSQKKTGFLTKKKVLREVVRWLRHKDKSSKGGQAKAEKTSATGSATDLPPPIPPPLDEYTPDGVSSSDDATTKPNEREADPELAVICDTFLAYLTKDQRNTKRQVVEWLKQWLDDVGPDDLREIIGTAQCSGRVNNPCAYIGRSVSNRKAERQSGHARPSLQAAHRRTGGDEIDAAFDNLDRMVLGEFG